MSVYEYVLLAGERMGMSMNTHELRSEGFLLLE